MGDEQIFNDLNIKLSIRDVEALEMVLIDEKTLREAQQWVSGCESCTEDTPITFDYVLDAVTGCSPVVTEYMMCRPAKCPVCSASITEKTLVVVA